MLKLIHIIFLSVNYLFIDINFMYGTIQILVNKIFRIFNIFALRVISKDIT